MIKILRYWIHKKGSYVDFQASRFTCISVSYVDLQANRFTKEVKGGLQAPLKASSRYGITTDVSRSLLAALN